MPAFPASPRFSLLVPLLAAAGCADESGARAPVADGGIPDLGLDPTAKLPAIEAPPTVDTASPSDAPLFDLRAPATRDAIAGETRRPLALPDAGRIFIDDFTPTASALWQAVDVRSSGDSPDTWPVIMVDSCSCAALTQGKIDGDIWHIAYADSELGENQIIEARLRVIDFYAPTPSYTAALFGRYDPNQQHGYFVALRADGSVTVRKRENGTNASWGGSVPQRFRAGVWYDVRLEIVGATIAAFIDGVEVYRVTDPTPLFGNYAGLGTFGATLEVDRFLAAEILEEEAGV